MAVELCSVTGCGTAKSKRGWCDKHYRRWWRTGDATTPPKWTPGDGLTCIVCGSPDLMDRSRRYCSLRCAQRLRRSKNDARALRRHLFCTVCGATIEMRVDTERKRRSDIRQCDTCKKRRGYRHKYPVRLLARRDVCLCGICGVAVDMSLSHPDPLSASVDHIRPRAHGGTDEPSNLQLAHLRCNVRKQGRFDGR